MDSICDYCGENIDADDALSCAECGGTFCEHHIDELEHDCEGAPDDEEAHTEG